MKKIALASGIVLALGLCVVFVGARFLRPYIRQSVYGVIGRTTQTAQMANAQDIRYQLHRVACEQTAVFVIDNLLKVKSFHDRNALFDHSLASVDPKLHGHYCEFGVGCGLTINYIASKCRETIHGFDSFEGLPETWRTDLPKGMFAVSKLPEVCENVKLHKGWFNETLPVWAKANPGPIAFMHIDADLYSSTKTVFDILGDRIVPGTVIQFDEYFNYPGWQQGEYKAFKEFVQARRVEFEYLGYNDQNEQVSVRILAVGSPAAD
jgi:hypothetical protein